MNRRQFLQHNAPLFLLPAFAPKLLSLPQKRVLSMGMIADLHHGLAPNAMQHLEVFMGVVDNQKPDILFQLGDFNFGRPDSKECMDLWQQFNGPTYHVLGNHDMDFFGKEHMEDLWGMTGRYYSFDRAGYHFVVLDRNNLRTDAGYIHYDTANFYVDSSLRGYADPEQLEWLQADLEATQLPTIVFAHQGLGMDVQDLSPDNAVGSVEDILKKALDTNGNPKVHTCFCGHHHLDRYNRKYGIHFVWINSASYYWVGDKYDRMAFYADPLFAFVHFYENGVLEIKGTRTDWESPSPAERGFPNSDNLTTFISDRTLS